jgi:hypothetical protein
MQVAKEYSLGLTRERKGGGGCRIERERGRPARARAANGDDDAIKQPPRKHKALSLAPLSLSAHTHTHANPLHHTHNRARPLLSSNTHNHILERQAPRGKGKREGNTTTDNAMSARVESLRFMGVVVPSGGEARLDQLEYNESVVETFNVTGVALGNPFDLAPRPATTRASPPPPRAGSVALAVVRAPRCPSPSCWPFSTRPGLKPRSTWCCAGGMF